MSDDEEKYVIHFQGVGSWVLVGLAIYGLFTLLEVFYHLGFH